MTDGVFVAGACQGPKDIPASVAQGAAAAARVQGMITKGKVMIEPIAKLYTSLGGKIRYCEKITRVTLDPKITWGSEPPSQEKLNELHEAAHKHCFIANSVTTEITVEPPL